MHFASCGTAILLGAALVPVAAPTILGAGATAALVTYVLLTSVRNSFGEIEQPDR